MREANQRGEVKSKSEFIAAFEMKRALRKIECTLKPLLVAFFFLGSTQEVKWCLVVFCSETVSGNPEKAL